MQESYTVFYWMPKKGRKSRTNPFDVTWFVYPQRFPVVE